MKPKVLIVGTVPYNEQSTSRAFESYFSNWERENLAQIFSNAKKPTIGHCKTLYQITDQRMVLKRVRRCMETGVIYNENELQNQWDDSAHEVNSPLFSKLYAWGKNKSPLTYIIRGIVWRKKYWCTGKLNQWLDDFGPECVFLSFSDDFFVPQIALYVAKHYDIPIVSSIGDDYYFNTHFSVSPFYYLYKLAYRRLIRRVFAHPGSAIYIGNKIRDKYNAAFGLDGETVYLSSSIQRREFREIDKASPKITYCGNIRLGRNTSLDDIGHALGMIDPQYILDIYSNESDDRYRRLFDTNPNVKFHGSVPYFQVQRIMTDSDITVIVEGYAKKDVDVTRYSLSTKAADALASGANVLGYGSPECGVIGYLKEICCGAVCTSFDELVPALKRLLNDVKYQRRNYENAERVTEESHNIACSTRTFEKIVERVTGNGKQIIAKAAYSSDPYMQ